MLRKILKASHNISLQDEQPSSKEAPEAWICLLPTEILTIIFSYLSPQSLVTIRKVGLKRLTEISLSLKVADFSLCNTVRAEDVSTFFSKDRLHCIKEISFDNVFFVKSLNLEKCIIKCKNLTVLSVIECGLSFTHILSIFKNCPQLEELYWTLCFKKPLPNFQGVFENIKKLYLYVIESKYLEYVGITKILEMCPRAHDVCLNLSPYVKRILPPEIARSVFTCKIFYKNREHPVNVVVSTSHLSFLEDIRLIMNNFSAVNQLNTEDLFINGEEMSFFLSNYSSFLQFVTEEKDLAKLSSVSDDSVHSLVVIMNESKARLLNYIDRIKRITGYKLRHLTLQNITSPKILINEGRLIEASDGTFVCDILSQIVPNSLNISVLNLSELHHDKAFPFSALYCLKQLKTLSLSACIMKNSSFECEPQFEDQIKGFEGLVENCKDVEKFSFHGCLWCQFGPTDEGLISVCKWRKLKAFTLSKIHTFRVCTFLMYISNECPDLQSLVLIDVGEPSVCHYTPGIGYILRKSKLLFLRCWIIWESTGYLFDNIIKYICSK